MTPPTDLEQQTSLAAVVASLYKGGHTNLAAETLVLVSSYNGQKVLFDDKDENSFFLKALRELLDSLGFDSIMHLSKEKAEKLSKISSFPSMVNLWQEFPSNMSNPVTPKEVHFS